jgi:UDP-2,4-diacetamido-2,4,6-trideoxy-beta-L-altropyranose hydrolase
MMLVVRADASTQMGTGHLMRCLALAQAIQEIGSQLLIVMAQSVPQLEQRLHHEKIAHALIDATPGSLEDAEATIAIATQLSAQWIVLDGYHFDAAYQQRIKVAGLRLLLLDDYGQATHYYADLILNQNASAREAWYQHREPETQLLLGPRYVLLRREFLTHLQRSRSHPDIAHKILVTLGGSDPDNATLKVIQALQQLEQVDLEIRVVVGGGNLHIVSLQTAANNCQFPVKMEQNVTHMPELMTWADVAIAAGGTTCWELAFMGVPSLLLILADNQQAIVQELDRLSVATGLGWAHETSAEQIAQAVGQLLESPGDRQRMSAQSQAMVDGEGAARVLMQLEDRPIRLRPAITHDCEPVWQWSNEPTVRMASFSSAPIPWDCHQFWFNQKLHDSNCHFFIGLDAQDVPVGQVRIDVVEGQQAQISLSLAPAQRGHGYGKLLIQLAVRQVLHKTSLQVIHAWIKPDNVPSVRTFEKAGFRFLGTETFNGHSALHYGYFRK